MPIYSEDQLNLAWDNVCNTAKELTEENGNPLLFLSEVQCLVSMIYINHAEAETSVDDEALKEYIARFNAHRPFPQTQIIQLCAVAIASMEYNSTANDPIADLVLISIRTGLRAFYSKLHPEAHINPRDQEYQLIKTFVSSQDIKNANQSFYFIHQQTTLNAFIQFFQQELADPGMSCSRQEITEIEEVITQTQNIKPDDQTQLDNIVRLNAVLGLMKKTHVAKKRLIERIQSQASTSKEKYTRLQAFTAHVEAIESRDEKIKGCQAILEKIPGLQLIENITAQLLPADGKEVFDQNAQLTKLQRFLIKLDLINKLKDRLTTSQHQQTQMVTTFYQTIFQLTQTTPQHAFQSLLDPLYDMLLPLHDLLNNLLDPAQNQTALRLTITDRLLNQISAVANHLYAVGTNNSGGFHAPRTTPIASSQPEIPFYAHDSLNQLANEMYLLTYSASESIAAQIPALINPLHQEIEQLKVRNVTNYEAKMALAKLLQRISTAIASTTLATQTIDEAEKQKKVSQAFSDIKKLSDQTKNSPRSDQLNACILRLMGSLLRTQLENLRFVPALIDAIANLTTPPATIETAAFEPLSAILLNLPKLELRANTSAEKKEKIQLRADILHNLSNLPKQIDKKGLSDCLYNLTAGALSTSTGLLEDANPRKRLIEQIMEETTQLAQNAKPARKIELTKLLNYVTAVLDDPSQKNLTALQTQSKKIAKSPRAKMLGMLLASLILLAIIGACIGMAVVSFGVAAPVTILGLHLGKCILAGAIASGLGALATGSLLTLGVKTTCPNGFFQNKLSERGIQKNVEALCRLPRNTAPSTTDPAPTVSGNSASG